ncbi:amino acid adenylation domain-containing protein [Viridibacterium curvum]|uniref:Non-ribosomal peptide synthetase n=1 Tax=Viridibacterium curvum TaxID=1101404 RepID=A0ABP9QFJ6_9RHOO
MNDRAVREVEQGAQPQRLPLSAAQLGIWLGQQLDPQSPAYWTAEAIELLGPLDPAAFESVLRQAIDECEALHMRYGIDEAEGMQVWQAHAPRAWSMRCIDLTDSSPSFPPALRTAEPLEAPLPRVGGGGGGEGWRESSVVESDVHGDAESHWIPASAGMTDLGERDDSALQAAHRWMHNDLQAPVDLEQGPLFATTLLRLPDTAQGARHVWLLRVHHVALDGFGYALLQRRVAALYAEATGTASPEPARPGVSLAAVVDEALHYQQHASERDRDFWVARLAATPVPVTLAPPAAVAHSVQRARGALDAAAFTRWQVAAQICAADWAAWLIAATAAWLAQQTRTTEVTLGLPVMNRLGSVGLSVPCMAMNIVPLHVRIDATQGMAALLKTVVAEMRDMRPHQRYRYEWLRHELARHELSRTSGPRRLFGPVINLMPFERPPAFGAVQALSHPVSAGPVEDLSITIAPGPDGVRLDFEANPDAYAADVLTAHREAFVAALDTLQRAAVDTPLAELLPGLPSPAQVLITSEALPTPPQGVLAAFIEQVQTRPASIAVEQDGVVLTYAELLQAVQTLAAELREYGVGDESRVAILLPRSPQTIVALLAVLWAGGAYVPLDPDSPDARVAMVLEDAQPALVLSVRALATRIPDALPTLYLDGPTTASAPRMEAPLAVADTALAYIIYTSGSTGKPNGVMIGRDALAHFLAGARLRYAMRHDDRVLQFAPLHFDASVEEIFLSLTCGARLVLRNEAMLESMPRFLAACAALQISVLDLPTAFWHELVYGLGATAKLPDAIRLVIIGGEAALAERVTRWRAAVAPHVVLLNTYGPTETTVICTTAALSGPEAIALDGEAVPIGLPLPGLSAVVVDAALRPVPRGEAGELCMIGGALARGYFGREEATAKRFVELSHAGTAASRAYRTGDRVSQRADGQLVYLGRLDDEFKISGYRVDPSEVETALLTYPGLREAAVVGQQLASGSKRLAAFIACEGDLPAASALQAHLANSLPAAAIPSAYIRIERLPRNANNKIDRGALRRMGLDAADAAPAALSESGGTPLSPLEQRIATVWREVLGAQDIARDTDFFALGGKSLQAIQVANRLGVALQREVAVSSLFRHPTVAQLAVALDVSAELDGHAPPEQASDPFAPLLRIQSGDATQPALFCVHPAEGLSWCYMGLAAQLRRTPIYGLQSRGISGESAAHIDEVIADYVALARSVQPHGPYRFMGWSSGGGIAHAMAARMQADGEQVELLAMMDAYPSDIWQGKPPPTERDALIVLLDVIGYAGKGHLGDDGQELSLAAMRTRLQRPGTVFADRDAASLARLTGQAIASMKLYRGLRHPVFNGNVLFFHAAQRSADAPDWLGWQPYVNGELQRIDIASTHNSMSQRAPLAHIGRVLAERLEN